MDDGKEALLFSDDDSAKDGLAVMILLIMEITACMGFVQSAKATSLTSCRIATGVAVLHIIVASPAPVGQLKCGVGGGILRDGLLSFSVRKVSACLLTNQQAY